MKKNIAISSGNDRLNKNFVVGCRLCVALSNVKYVPLIGSEKDLLKINIAKPCTK